MSDHQIFYQTLYPALHNVCILVQHGVGVIVALPLLPMMAVAWVYVDFDRILSFPLPPRVESALVKVKLEARRFCSLYICPSLYLSIPLHMCECYNRFRSLSYVFVNCYFSCGSAKGSGFEVLVLLPVTSSTRVGITMCFVFGQTYESSCPKTQPYL